MLSYGFMKTGTCVKLNTPVFLACVVVQDTNRILNPRQLI